MTDIHVGDPEDWEAGELQALFDYADGLGAAMVLMTGDLTNGSYAAEFTEFLALRASLSTQNYVLSGNHDMQPDFTQWNAAGLEHHFVVDQGNYRFIGFESISTVDVNTDGRVLADELTWLETQLQGAGTKNIVMMTHFPMEYAGPIQSGEGYEEAAALLQTYGVKMFTCGHVHIGTQTKTVAGVAHVNGAAAAWVTGNLDGGLMVLNCCANRIDIEYHRARAPFDAFGPATTPVYAPVSIRF